MPCRMPPTNATTITPYYGCMASGQIAAPTMNSLSTFTLTGAAAMAITDKTGSFSFTCAAGKQMIVRLVADTHLLSNELDIWMVRLYQ